MARKKRRTSRKKSNGKFRRVSKVGAYRKKQKKNFVRKRAPVVETKRKGFESLRQLDYYTGGSAVTQDVINQMIYDSTEYTAFDTPHVFMNPLTYMVWSQGLDQAQHIGQSITVKYTNMKIQVRFPQSSSTASVDYGAGPVTLPQRIPERPQNYELIWGWVNHPLNLTGQTTPAANVVTLQQIEDSVNDRVADYFNARKDRLRFIPKTESTLKIIGRKKVRPDLRHSSTVPAEYGGTTAPGTVPDYFTEISWKHNDKKLHLEQTGNLNASIKEDEKVIGMYPNYQWLPFCVMVVWDFEELPTFTDANGNAFGRRLSVPKLKWNDITYFSDS